MCVTCESVPINHAPVCEHDMKRMFNALTTNYHIDTCIKCGFYEVIDKRGEYNANPS